MIPTSADGLTAEYLAGLLRRHGHVVTVADVTAEPIGSGQMAGSYRLVLDGSGDEVPRTLVAKMAVGDASQREFASGAFRNEVRFYSEIVGTLDVPVPRAYGWDISESGAEFVLLLEDLAPAEQGDQIAGCTPEQVQAIAVAASGLHAPRWCDETWFDVDGFGPVTHDDRLLLESVLEPMADALRGRLDLSDQEEAAVAWLVAEAGDWVERPPSRFALTHGDLRIDNVMFAPDGRVTIVDWQTITPGHPLRDIAFLVSTSLSMDDRRRHERGIVAAYHRALSERGVVDYSLDECWTDYLGSLMQAPLIVVFGAGAAQPTERGDRMFQTMLHRSAAAIADHTP